MNNQKGFSSLIGIVIIVAVAVVAVGGIFGYQYLSQPKELTDVNDNQNIVGGDKDEHGCIGSAGYSWCEVKQKCLRTWEEPCEAAVVDQTAPQQLSDATIISAIDKLEAIKLEKNNLGIYEALIPAIQGGYNIGLITKGDLNGDGIQDAVVWGTMCGASCGSVFTTILNKNDGLVDAFRVSPNGFISSGAAQYAVKSIIINNGTISIETKIPAFDGSTTNATLNYKLVGNNLIDF